MGHSKEDKDSRAIISPRDPSALDRRHKIGSLWINKCLNKAFILTSVESGQANWMLATCAPAPKSEKKKEAPKSEENAEAPAQEKLALKKEQKVSTKSNKKSS